MPDSGSRNAWRAAQFSWPVRFFLAAFVVIFIGVPLTVLSPDPVLSLAAVVAALASLLLPVRCVALAWGFILPIYGSVGVAPVWFDVARLAGAVLIAARLPAERSSKPFQLMAIPLLAAGSMQMINGWLTPHEDYRPGAFILLSVIVALVIALRPSTYAAVLGGFCVGATVSSIVAIMQVMELPNPALPLVGYARFQGLSSAAPRAAVEMSVAALLMCVWLVHARARPKPLRIVAVLASLICLFALLACGGRGGLLGLVLAAIIATRLGLLRARHLVGVAFIAACTLYLAERYGLALSTLDRISGNSTTGIESADITNGRGALFWEALHETFAHPIVGIGATNFRAEYGNFPHVAPLNLAISGGVVGAVAGIWLLCALVAICFASPSAEARWQSHAGRCIAGILLVLALLDVNGPFLGAGLVTLLLVSLGLTRPLPVRRTASISPASPHLSKSLSGVTGNE